MGDAKATDAAFSRAARVVALELVNNRVVVNSMEPRNAIADFDPASGRSTLYTRRKVRILCVTRSPTQCSRSRRRCSD